MLFYSNQTQTLCLKENQKSLIINQTQLGALIKQMHHINSRNDHLGTGIALVLYFANNQCQTLFDCFMHNNSFIKDLAKRNIHIKFKVNVPQLGYALFYDTRTSVDVHFSIRVTK